jgi:GTPase SAR1 family protein
VCVFDVTSEESLPRVMIWLRDLKSHADPNVVVCIAGNKCDKPAKFDLSKCEEFADSIGAKFFKTSALTGENVDKVFNSLARTICQVYNVKAKVEAPEDDILTLTQSGKKNSGGGCC